MKIAVIGDTHFGFDHYGKRRDDALRNAKEAFELALSEKVDFIIQTGDVFDERLPKPEVVSPVIQLMKNISGRSNKIKLVRRISGDDEELVTAEIPPVLMIYGDHDRRPKEYINPVQILHNAGLIYCLDRETIVLEKDNKRIAIHGFSNVPHQYARDVLKKHKFQAIPNMKNLLVIHQSFQELLPNQAPEIMNYSDLPEQMDAHFLGHIHWKQEDKHPSSKSPILLPGSTVQTQMKKIESKVSKGIYILDIGEKINYKFLELKKPRKLYHETIEIDGDKPSEINTKIQETVRKILDYHNHELIPMIRIVLKGVLHDGFIPSDISMKNLLKKYESRAIINIGKSKLVSEKLNEKSKLIHDLKTKKISIEDLGLKILGEKLNVKKLDKLESIFSALKGGDLNKAEEIL